MIAKRLFRPSHATIVAYLALFVALGGTTYAATSLPANSVGTKQLANGAVTTGKLHNQAVTAGKVANHSLTGAQINVAALGTVPNAAHAANADQLAGAPASSYLAHCPTGLVKVPNGNLCFDPNVRPEATWADALNICAQAGLKLPTEGELVQAFNDLDASQTSQWTSTGFDASFGFAALLVNDNSSRAIDVAASSLSNTAPYRCVTYASN